MSLEARLRRLEQAEETRLLRATVEGLAARHGQSPDGLWRMLEEVTRRVARWGVDGELQHMAREYGWTEDEMRRRYADAVRTCEEITDGLRCKE